MSDHRTEEIARLEGERKQRTARLSEELRTLDLKAHEKAQLAAELQGVINILVSLAAYKPENPIYAAFQEKLTEALHHPYLQSSTSPVLGGYGPAASSPDITPATPTTVITTPEEHLAALRTLDEKLSILIGNARVPESLKEVFRALQEDVKRSIPVVKQQIEEASVELLSTPTPTPTPTLTANPTATPPSPFLKSRDEDLEAELPALQENFQREAYRADAAELEVAKLSEKLQSEVTAGRERIAELENQLVTVTAEVAKATALEERSRASQEEATKVAGLEAQLAKVQEESEQRQSQLKTTKADVTAQIEAATASAKQEAEAASQKRIEALESELGLLQSRLDSAPDELQQEIARLKRALEENVTSPKSELALLKKQLGSKETRALAAEALVSRLRKDLHSLQSETQSPELTRNTENREKVEEMSQQQLKEKLAAVKPQNLKKDSHALGHDSSPAPGAGPGRR